MARIAGPSPHFIRAGRGVAHSRSTSSGAPGWWNAITSQGADRNSRRALAYSWWRDAASTPQSRAISRIGIPSWNRSLSSSTRRVASSPCWAARTDCRSAASGTTATAQARSKTRETPPHGRGGRRARRRRSGPGRAGARLASARRRNVARPRRGTRGTPPADRPAPDRAGRHPGGTQGRHPGRCRRVPGAASSPATGPPGRPGPPAYTGRRIRHERTRPPRRRHGAGSSRWNLDPPCSPHVDVAPESGPLTSLPRASPAGACAVHQGERDGPAVDLRGVAGQEHLQGGPRVVHARLGWSRSRRHGSGRPRSTCWPRPSPGRSGVRASPGPRW